MNNYEEIKKLVESSRKIFSNINENTKSDIRKKYSMLSEQKILQSDDIEITSEKKDSDDIGKKHDKQKGYKIQGNILILHGESEGKFTTHH